MGMRGKDWSPNELVIFINRVMAQLEYPEENDENDLLRECTSRLLDIERQCAATFEELQIVFPESSEPMGVIKVEDQTWEYVSDLDRVMFDTDTNRYPCTFEGHDVVDYDSTAYAGVTRLYRRVKE